MIFHVKATSPKATGMMIKRNFVCNSVAYILRSKTEDLEKFYTEVSSVVGTCVPMEEDPNTGDKTGVMYTHIKHPWHKYSSSYSHSETRQPLHTDGSYESNAPDITYFSCKTKAKYGGDTTFIGKNELVKILEYHDPGLLKRLRNTPIRFSKGADSKQRPIIGEDNKLTWNRHRCDSCSLTDDFHQFLETRIVQGGLLQSIKLNPGQALFFMDEEVLHGRNSFIGPRWLIKGGLRYERPNDS